MRYRTYTLRIEAEEGTRLTDMWSADLDSGIQDAEDVVNDRLPEGFYCKIDESGDVRLTGIQFGEGVDLAAVRALEEYAGEDGA